MKICNDNAGLTALGLPGLLTVRNERIDILRFIGLAMIILAHCGAPASVNQIRGFDVPLMVIVSGLSFYASYQQEPYRTYLWKRFKRLVFPTWLFLTVYFSFVFFTSYPIQLPDWAVILSSYLLLEGIGFVWIIRVFLLVAVVSPFIMQINRRTHSHATYFLLVALLCVVNEIALAASRPYFDSFGGQLFENIVLYTLPYSAVFAIGLRFPELTRKRVTLVSLCAFLIFCGLAYKYSLASGGYVYTQKFKYPPQAYYLSYAVCVSSLLWILSGRISQCLKYLRLSGVVNYLAQNSMWVYLWHIPAVAAVNYSYYFKYPLVLSFAALVTFLQERLVNLIILPQIKSAPHKKTIRLLLTG